MGYQHVKKESEDSSIVTVDLENPQEAYASEKEDQTFTSPSAMLDNEDEAIRALAQEALQKGHKQIRALSVRVSEADRLIRKWLPAREGEGGSGDGFKELLQAFQELKARYDEQAARNEAKDDQRGEAKSSLGGRVQQYIKILQKIMDEGEGWVGKEMKRVKKMLKKKAKLTVSRKRDRSRSRSERVGGRGL